MYNTILCTVFLIHNLRIFITCHICLIHYYILLIHISNTLLWITYFYTCHIFLIHVTYFINPKPHGSGRICPHLFQRPITQKVLKCKKSVKIPIPRKTSAESKSWVMYPSKNFNLCLFYASEQAKVQKKATNWIYYLSWPPHFRPHPGGGVGWQGGVGGKLQTGKNRPGKWNRMAFWTWRLG